MIPPIERPLPITGIALCGPLGGSVTESRTALRKGEAGLFASPLEVPFPTVVGAVRTKLPGLPAALEGWTTRTTQIAQQLITELDAPLARLRERVAPERIAVILGTSTAGADVTEEAYRTYLTDGALPADYNLFRHHTYGAVLHVVRTLIDASGPAWVISTACTSSAKPLASAQRLIRTGLADAALVGGIDTLCRMTLRGFHALDALSSEPCRPFSAERRGLNIGEGGAFMLLERDGIGNNDPLAVLEGVGESSDAYHIAAPHPEGQGAQLAMRRALAQAGLEPDAVDHINAHGTGTRLNDSAESRAIAELFGTEIPVVSTKSYTGHMLGAAGATEAVFGVMAIQDGFIPASLRADPPDDEIKVNVARQSIEGPIRRVLSNSFAFGGNNVSALIGAPR